MPRYDFKCCECSQVHEFDIKLKDYNLKRTLIRCPACGGHMNRMMDYKGGFQLKGAGWFGADGTGTGYEITQNEMDKTGDDNKFLEERMG